MTNFYKNPVVQGHHLYFDHSDCIKASVQFPTIYLKKFRAVEYIREAHWKNYNLKTKDFDSLKEAVEWLQNRAVSRYIIWA